MLVSGDEHGVDGDPERIEAMSERQMCRAGFVDVGRMFADTCFEPCPELNPALQRFFDR